MIRFPRPDLRNGTALQRGALLLAVAMAAPASAQPPAMPRATVAAPAPAQSPPAQQPLPGGASFISPAGEPVLSSDALSGAEHWFVAADTDRDGRLTLAEVRADADRFFARLDVDHDGELGPSEIEQYEMRIAPEIQVRSTGGAPIPSGEDGATREAPYPDRIGAGRYGYIDLPEPIIAMDANFDRGVTRAEFDRAMAQRFALLDTNHDGFITRDELPRIAPAHEGSRRGGGGRHDGGHRGSGGHGGGGGGGGFGGGGPDRPGAGGFGQQE